MREWIALLGKRDTPTDGVEDYCTFLGKALAARGIELKQRRVAWVENGWLRAVRHLRRESVNWRGTWVLIQYTALGWSRRGFPFFVVGVLSALQRDGARVVVVFHESNRQRGSRWIDRIRGACQDWVIRKLYRGATKAVFTLPLEAVSWLPKDSDKAAFIPIGANIPERLDRSWKLRPSDQAKTVIVFGVTGVPRAVGEVKEIAAVMREVAKILPALRLVVVGRGALEVRGPIKEALAGSGIEIVVRGVLPAEEVACEFERADVLLFVRGAVTPQRGSAIAAIACGVPLVGYADGKARGPLEGAGIEWSDRDDRKSFVRALVRVLSDAGRWTELHERNIQVQRNHFSWARIAERYVGVLIE